MKTDERTRFYDMMMYTLLVIVFTWVCQFIEVVTVLDLIKVITFLAFYGSIMILIAVRIIEGKR
jgi:hypothetical protein